MYGEYQSYYYSDDYVADHGIRNDTFLADMKTLSEEDTQSHRSYEEEKEIEEKLLDVLRRENRLPDDKGESLNTLEESLQTVEGAQIMLKKEFPN